jgi:hypothetical protein
MTMRQSSGPTLAVMHQGAEKSACRKIPPESLTMRKRSDNASMIFLSKLRRIEQVFRRNGHS